MDISTSHKSQTPGQIVREKDLRCLNVSHEIRTKFKKIIFQKRYEASLSNMYTKEQIKFNSRQI